MSPDLLMVAACTDLNAELLDHHLLSDTEMVQHQHIQAACQAVSGQHLFKGMALSALVVPDSNVCLSL